MSAPLPPQAYWDGRFRLHGHTGDGDPLLYAYDQPQRLRAIERALARAGVHITPATRALDLGCGSGDIIALLAGRGPAAITGVDFSAAALEAARARFASQRAVQLLALPLEQMDFPPGSFDLVTAINVLQHIPGPAFERVVGEIARTLAGGGRALTMDFSPVKVGRRDAGPYTAIRSRGEYVQAFARAGCRLVSEYGLPRIGVRLYRLAERAAGLLRRPPPLPAPLEGGDPASAPRRLRALRLRRALLALALPLDRALAPFPAALTDMRLLLFQKSAP